MDVAHALRNLKLRVSETFLALKTLNLSSTLSSCTFMIFSSASHILKTDFAIRYAVFKINQLLTNKRTHARTHAHTVVSDVTTQKHEGTCAGWQTCFYWRCHRTKVSLAFAVSSSAYASDCLAHCNMLQPYWWHISVTSWHSALDGWVASSNTDVTPLTPSNGSGQSERSQFQFLAWHYPR